MMPCKPPCPGQGMNITISIDLGDFLGGKCPVPDKMPDECDDDKLTYFNENNRPKNKGFKETAENVADKFGHRPKRTGDPDESSFSEEDDEDKK